MAEKQTPETAAAEKKSVAPVAEATPVKEEEALKDDPNKASNMQKEAMPQGEKLLAMLGYIGFLCVLPLAIKPKSEFCQHHGKQGLVLCLIFILFGWLGWLGGGMAILLGLIHVGLALWGIVNAKSGAMWNMPMVSEVAKKLKWD